MAINPRGAFNLELHVFEEALRTRAVPPIKGEITKGKLKWRGIVMVHQDDAKWLSQRGERISLKIICERN
jgi:hypothetical protein